MVTAVAAILGPHSFSSLPSKRLEGLRCDARPDALDHAFAQEWIDVVKRAWSEEPNFDFNGQFLKLAGIRAKPKPYGGTRPIIMNAGSSGTGQAFALRNCDAFFTATNASRKSIEGTAKKVAEVKAQVRKFDRNIEVYTVGHVICRPTQREADEYYRHAFIDNADWGAVERMMALRNLTRESLTAEEYTAKRHYFAANAIGGYPFVGTPDKVADELANLSRAGVRGIALSLVNYVGELPYLSEEVLPRLTRLGLRQSP